MNITDLIVELLQQGQTIVLPGIGTLESVMQDAHHDSASGIYYPTHRTLAFRNDADNSNDAIVKTLAERECVSTDVANQMWRNYIDALTDKMARTGHHAFGELGTLSGNGKEGYSFAVAEGLMLGNTEEQPIADVKVYDHSSNDDPFAAFDDDAPASTVTKEDIIAEQKPEPTPEPTPEPIPEPTPEPVQHDEESGTNMNWNDELRKLEDMPKSAAELKAEKKAEEKAEKARLKAEKKAEEERLRLEKLAEEEKAKIEKRAAEVKAAAEREQRRAEKEAAEQASRAEKEAAKQAKRAEKESKEQAKRAEKEAKEQAKRAEKEAKEQAKRNKKLADELIAAPKSIEPTKPLEEKEEKKKKFPWWIIILLLLLAGACCYYYYLSHPNNGTGNNSDNRRLKDVPAANSFTYNYDLIEYNDNEIDATRDLACDYLKDYINLYLAYRNYNGARVAMMDRVRQYAGQRLGELMADRFAVQRFIPHNDYIYEFNEPFMKAHFADSMRYKVQGELLDMNLLDQILDQLVDELGLQQDGDNQKTAAEVQQVKATERKAIERRKAASSDEEPAYAHVEKNSKLGFDIIAGFYLNKNTATRLTARLHNLGCDAYIIEKNDMYYVSMGSAKDRTSAEALFNHIKGWYDGDIAIKQW